MRAALALASLLIAGVGGCATLFPKPPTQQPLHPANPEGHWHKVEPGETLLAIAVDAEVPLQDLMEINGIDDADKLQVGQMIYVLDPRSVAPRAQPHSGAPTGAPEEGPPPSGPLGPPPSTTTDATRRAQAMDHPLRWPLDEPVVTSPYGPRWGRVHEGVDLSAPTGTPVRAADHGEVAYAGDQIRGYGNMVVVQHDSGLLTVYAHNSVVLVRVGDRVGRGQMIARVGQSGRATAPHLHFEVRKGETPEDPASYLPPLGR